MRTRGIHQVKRAQDKIVTKGASPPMYHQCDSLKFVLSPEFCGSKFDVTLANPPWEEYVHQAPGVAMDYWIFEEILNLKFEAIANTPSLVFLWVGNGGNLERVCQFVKKGI